MKEVLFKILENKKIAKDIYEMKLSGDTSDITRPGQFIDLKLDGFYLRRPISVCDLEGDQLTII
ncbi:MAG: dihydroorotate dehydrogenase electron transfer subunit, partial [Oscillospiraceae bacterium]|nr:dihydroorotate dehydrogenase electron transfer subunit [Oscillospiraceae bacterium]